MRLIDTLRRKAFNWLAGDTVNGPQFGTSYSTRGTIPPKIEFNSIVTAVVQAVSRSVIEPPLGIVKAGDESPNREHALCQMIENPQRFEGSARLSGMALWQLTIASRMIEGNAYWVKVRSGRTVIGFDFLRFDQCKPVAQDGTSNILTAYQIRTSGGAWQTVPIEDIVHFRWGQNPSKPLEGMSPIHSCIREVCTDSEAVTYMSAIVRNPSAGVMMVPADATVKLTEDSAKMMAEYIKQISSGENMGRTIVPSVAMKAERFGLSPEEMALDKILRLPEQRITAVFGVPAIVVGLGAGLERSTFANFKEAREAFTESVMVPLWRDLGDTVTNQLGEDFGLKPGERAEFDISEVRALQDDVNALYKRITDGWNGGLLTIGQCYRMLGEDLPAGMDENERKAAPAKVDPNQSGEPPKSDPMKAWESAMAKKWQERAAS